MRAVIFKPGLPRNPYFYKPPGIFEKGLGALLPPEYLKFYEEWQAEPTPVHFIPKAGVFQRNSRGDVTPVQNVPLPLKYPREFHNGIWGGEAVIKGFQKRHPTKRRIPYFWMPRLQKSVVYSAVLNKYMNVVVTERTLQLIHHHQGFDDYLLQTEANDLKSFLALGIKREILKALKDGCPALAHDPDKQNEVLAKYKKYADEFTPTEVDWYGYNLYHAISRIRKQQEAEAAAKIVPLKREYRSRLIEQLKASGLEIVEQIIRAEDGKIVEQKQEKSSWISKYNPFGKK